MNHDGMEFPELLNATPDLLPRFHNKVAAGCELLSRAHLPHVMDAFSNLELFVSFVYSRKWS